MINWISEEDYRENRGEEIILKDSRTKGYIFPNLKFHWIANKWKKDPYQGLTSWNFWKTRNKKKILSFQIEKKKKK